MALGVFENNNAEASSVGPSFNLRAKPVLDEEAESLSQSDRGGVLALPFPYPCLSLSLHTPPQHTYTQRPTNMHVDLPAELAAPDSLESPS